MRPLILITNDDGVEAKGLKALTSVAQELGEVVVMAPERNASGKSHSVTSDRPLRVRTVMKGERLAVYCCDGTPVDCVKLATEHFCPRRPDLVLSGINHGSNSSINVLYSGTMGAVLEATTLGFVAGGFSLLNHSADADFSAGVPWIRQIVKSMLEGGVPEGVALNVNIPRVNAEELKGIRVCHAARGMWIDSFVRREDPRNQPYWWLTGKFVCDNPEEGSDEWALAHGYISVVPLRPDFTDHEAIGKLRIEN